MGTFGENLRREREMRGVTLEEISAATKISVHFLQCVEGEKFSQLPGGIFTRSFIRSYARYVGLDEDALLAEYQLIAKDQGEPDLSRLPTVRSLPPQPKPSRSGWVALPLAVVLLVAGYAVWRYSRRGLYQLPSTPSAAAAAAPKSSAQGAAAAAPGTNPSNPQGNAAPAAGSAAGIAPPTGAAASGLTLQTANPAAGAASATSADADGLTLQVAAAERSWVAVDADGKTVLQGILNPNDVKTLHAQNAFDVLTGNAQGIILTLNGRTLEPLGREGEVKTVHLTRSDLKSAAP